LIGHYDCNTKLAILLSAILEKTNAEAQAHLIGKTLQSAKELAQMILTGRKLSSATKVRSI